MKQKLPCAESPNSIAFCLQTSEVGEEFLTIFQRLKLVKVK
jgi:hypothetical protein